MSSALLFAAYLLSGVLLRRSGLVGGRATAALNRLILSVPLPAVMLLHAHELQFDRSLLVAALAPWLLFGFGIAFFSAAGRAAGWPRATVGCLILTAALGNTSYVGLPAIRLLFGEDLLGVGVFSDQAGTFLAAAVAGPILAAYFAGHSVSGGALVTRVISFPPFVAMVVALATRPLAYPPVLVSVLEACGAALTPLALIVVGLQLRLAGWRGHAASLGWGLTYKLALGPGFVCATLAAITVDRGPAFQIGVFEAAMPPMITGGLIAIEHGLDKDLATLLIGVGIPIAFVTLPAWWWILTDL